jgi:hypothetical protein
MGIAAHNACVGHWPLGGLLTLEEASAELHSQNAAHRIINSVKGDISPLDLSNGVLQ